MVGKHTEEQNLARMEAVSEVRESEVSEDQMLTSPQPQLPLEKILSATK